MVFYSAMIEWVWVELELCLTRDWVSSSDLQRVGLRESFLRNERSYLCDVLL